MIKTTLRIQKIVVCDCSAYRHPHAVGSGSCSKRITESFSFVPPKRGLASKLFKFLHAIESELKDTSDSESILSLLRQFKQALIDD